MASSVLSSLGRIETICSRFGRPSARCRRSDFIKPARAGRLLVPSTPASISAMRACALRQAPLLTIATDCQTGSAAFALPLPAAKTPRALGTLVVHSHAASEAIFTRAPPLSVTFTWKKSPAVFGPEPALLPTTTIWFAPLSSATERSKFCGSAQLSPPPIFLPFTNSS